MAALPRPPADCADGPTPRRTVQRPAAELPEELVEEILLRFPPGDPARLVRAALIGKRWCRFIHSPAFRRRFRDLHGAPPMLGFFVSGGTSSHFVRTSSSGPRFSAAHRDGKVVDARHGRVLLRDVRCHRREYAFVVWDPITDQRWELPLLQGCRRRPHSWNAAVLCAAAASLDGTCDHLDCHGGHFLVVVVGPRKRRMLAHVYSSETGAWSEPTSRQHLHCSVGRAPKAGVLVGNALCFLREDYTGILKYDLGTQDMSLIHIPASYCSNYFFGHVFLTTMEGGGLGLTTAVNSTLYLWSWEASRGRGTDAGWAESRSIELKTLFPSGVESASCYVIGCAGSIGVIFLYSDVGVFTIDLKTNRVTRVSKRNLVVNVIPYLSFCKPAFGACIAEGPRPRVLNA